MRRNFYGLLLFTLLFAFGAVAAHAAPTITRRSSPVFYTDFGKGLTSMYVGYEIANDGVDRSNVYATISGFTGGFVSLAPNENGVISIGAMAPNETKMAFFYLSATALTATPQGHTVTLLDNAPGIGATIASANFSLTGVEDTIAANANKVNTTVTTPNPPSVGGLVTITVTGGTGTIGSPVVLAFTPASFSNWRADALQLINTQITFTGGNAGTFTNTLLIPTAGLNSADTSYTAVYNFRIINTTGVSTPVSPVGYISSGTQVKHTDTGDFANLQPILPSQNTTILAKNASATNLPTGGLVTYTLRLTNSGPYSVQFDRIVDVLPSSPANATYVNNSATFNGAAFGNPSVSGQTLTWTGTFVVPSGAFREFTYQATIPNIGGSYVNRATVYLENTRIDTTQSTSDDAPAQASIAVPDADIVVTKSGPAAAIVGNTFAYTISYQNNGPTGAQNVVLRDTLPAQVTFVSATGGGVHSAGVVSWTLPTVANGATGSFTVTVRGASAGSAVNVASSTSDTYDPNTANNDGSASGARVTTTLTTNADVVVTKSGPAAVQVGQPFTYTITATNNGPSPAQGVILSDELPAQVTFGSASNGGTHSAGTVTWPSILSIASGADVSYTVTVTAVAEGTFTNIARGTATTTDPSAGNNNGTAAASRVTTVATNGFPLSGYVYNDANLNTRRDESEVGTGLILYVKAVSTSQPAGPAYAAAAVDAATGIYSFSAVAPAIYTLILDDNADLQDVTPVQPAGWTGTESAGGVRGPVAVSTLPVSEQNFGLANAVPVQGRTFIDNGTGGGSANDGVLNGGEPGLANSVLSLTDAAGATVYSTVSSDASGDFTLFIPTGLAHGTALRIVETNSTGSISTGGTAGTTGGTYARAIDAVTFNLVTGMAYTGVSFGNLLANTLTTDGQQSGLPGTVVFYPHTFTAASAGTVTFATSHIATPANSGWTSVVLRDVNANGQFDATEPAITAPVTVAAGESIALLVKVFIPVNAPLGAKDQSTLTATFNYTGAAPALSSTATRQDVTTVGDPTTAGLTLVKSVSKATARPGETLTYTIGYTNNSSEPLRQIVIHDTTPAFTTFVSNAQGALPNSLTAVNVTPPAVGAAGAIRWVFTGTLAPASSGTVSFTIKVDE
ncbi:MAG TPA: DUF11 domain-containing protein [Chthoniobacteraceae bacterium]